MNAGIRSHSWLVSGDAVASAKQQTEFSPRAQFAIKPDWKKDMVFRFSTTPFLSGIAKPMIPEVKAQQSIHFVLSKEYQNEIQRKSIVDECGDSFS